MQNTHISDRDGSNLLRNVSKCSFAAKKMKRRWDQTENRLPLLNGRERRGQRAGSGMSKYPKSWICHASHCLRSGVETAADILGGLHLSHICMHPSMAPLLWWEPQYHSPQLPLSPACPGGGRAGATQPNLGPWTGPSVNHKQNI